MAAVLMVIVVGTAIGTYRYQLGEQRMSASAEISALAKFKAREISAWLKERRGDADLVRRLPLFAETLAGSSATRKPIHQGAWMTILESLVSIQGHKSAFVLDGAGHYQFGAGATVDPADFPVELIDEAMATGQTVRMRLRPVGSGDRATAYFDTVVPVGASTEAPAWGVIVLRMDAGESLVPLLQYSPELSETMDLYLIRDEGASVTYLSPLRHRASGGLFLLVPKSERNQAAVKAVLALDKVREALDYRGVPVITVSHRVDQSNWFVVANEEIGSIKQEAIGNSLPLFAFILAIAATSAAIFGIRLVYARREYAQQVRLQRLEQTVREKHLDLFTRFARDIVILRDASMRILECNDATLGAYGYSLEELRAMEPGALRSPKAREGFAADLSNTDLLGGTLFETEHQRKDGTTFPVEVSTRMIEFEGQRFYHSTIRDISERKLAEEMANRTELRLRHVLHAIDEILYVVEVVPADLLRGSVRFVSDRVKQILGYDADEFIANRDLWPSLIHAEDLAAMKEQTQAMLASGDPTTRKYRVLSRLEGYRWLEDRVSPQKDAAGRVTSLIGVARDITDQARNEQLLNLEHAIARRLAGATKASVGIMAILRTICQSEHWARGTYWEVDEASGVLRFGEAWSTPGAGLERYSEGSRSVVFAPGVGLAGRVWQSGEPLWTADFGNDPRVVQKDLAQATGLRGNFCFPVIAEGKAIGVLAFFSREIREPDERLLLATRTIGRQVGQFLMRMRAERALLDSESRHRLITELARDGLVTADHEGRIISWNRSAERLFLYAEAEALGQPLSMLMPTEYRARHNAGLARVSAGGESSLMGKRVELCGLRKDGTEFPLELSLTTWGSGTERCYSGFIRDISDRKAAERRIGYLTRLYAMLSQTNTAIVHSRSQEELFERICGTVVEHGEMLGSIVRIADTAARVLRPVAYTESMRTVAEQGVIDVDPASARFNPQIATAFLEDRIEIIENFVVTNPQDPWQVVVNQAGIRSGALLPIRRGDKPVGLLAINSSETHFFDQEMRSLLEEMVGDIAFALDNFEYERRRRQAEKALKESEERFRGLVEQAIAGIYIVEGDRLTYVNPRFAAIFGYRQEELIDSDAQALVAEESRAAVAESMRRRMTGETSAVQYTFVGLRKDGSKFSVGAHGALASIDGRRATIGLVQDISEREQAQRQIESYIVQLEGAMMATVRVASNMGEMRDPYTRGHERRVGELCAAIGEELGMSSHQVEGLRVAGNLHDIGKVAVPAEILSKPGRLSAAEFALVKDHPLQGHEILKDAEFPWPVAKVALMHHERLDGSGYPQGLKGDEIILEARILAVADVVEAMSSHRPYRPGRGLEASLKEIEKLRGSHYDARVVDACLRIFREKGYRIPD